MSQPSEKKDSVTKLQERLKEAKDLCKSLEGRYVTVWPRMKQADKLMNFQLHLLNPMIDSMNHLALPVEERMENPFGTIKACARAVVIMTHSGKVEDLVQIPRSNSKVMKKEGEAIRKEVKRIVKIWNRLRGLSIWSTLATDPQNEKLKRDNDELRKLLREDVDEAFNVVGKETAAGGAAKKRVKTVADNSVVVVE